MAWAIIGSAMLRICVSQLPEVVLFLIYDDFVGFGTSEPACAFAAQFVRETIIKTCGPGSVSLDKSVLTQQPIIIGWYVDFINPIMGASIAPNDKSIDKMCYYFFSFDPSQ